MQPEIILTRPDRDRLANIVHAFSARAQAVLVDFLDQEISRARVVDPQEVPRDVATMNSRIVYRDEQSSEEHAVALVYPGEEDSIIGRLSVMSPLGTALLGLREGQTISWTALNGRERRVTLMRVLFQPETAGLPQL